MNATIRTTAAALLGSAAAIALAASALAQTATGSAQFRDEKTGKIWTPDNVSNDNRLRPANEPSTPADRAFNPNAQIATATGVVVQRPAATLMGVGPITAGPTVPIVSLDSPSLQAIPGDRWVAPLYVTNNSGADANVQVGCTFTNAGRPVQETRIVVPTAGPGQRLAMAAYGPRTEVFVDRVLCRVLTP
jgi:hypothetical protein